MYKTKVQELCQKKSWSLPEYETTREGPDHNRRFTSTVTVNGVPFHSPSPCRTVKESQNTAAMLAFNHFSQPNPNPNPNPNPISLCPLYSFPQPSLSGFSSFPQPSLCAPSTPSPSSSPSSGFAAPSTDVDNILPASRELQPKLEEACQTSQISSPVSAVRDIMTAGDQKNMLHLYKNQLQSYAQKRNLHLPVYSSEWEGPPHAMRFKCKVTIDGQTFESHKFFSSLKDAQHAAAEVALMSLSPGGVQEDHIVLYKNLLQELVQKEGFSLPIYSTNKSGEAHMPIFLSQVEVEGELFTGQEAKSKKQAEMSAAKVAYMTLKERKEANVIPSPQLHANPRSPVSPGLITCNQPDKHKGKSDQSSSFPFSAHQGQAPEFSSDQSESNIITGLEHQAKSKSLVSPGLLTWNQTDKDKLKKGLSSCGNTNGCIEDSSLSNGQCAPSPSDSTNVVSDTSNEPSNALATPSHRRKVVVYSRKTNVEVEGGGTLMPISDDNWVVYSYSQ
ncbi:double-stranded RNA-binding protein 4-like isoform X3 [Gastrolobium bilobum]|uniref:double-stranded RNA-binding protein 4-like isoform X3 n=1 Tax=Gastrolobium bilobum TaxID=150636 RepID=UPI002AB15D06|nr:double-stranded RNA-binding protein 4-like isoform X3 [Gastrolobium bilobum]